MDSQISDLLPQNLEHLNSLTISNLNSPSSSSSIAGIAAVGGYGNFSNGTSGAGNNSSNSSVVGVSINGGCGEIFQSVQQLVSTNSFELNVVTSLSDDSGVPLTNSSISSGDSYRLGLCKLELELVESDGEVSQFDSLGDSSDGGMSAENFNTLKKGPLAPIDPPPEFQDSPQTTMLRSKLLQNYALNLSEHVIVTALNDWSPPPPIKDDTNDDEDDENDFHDHHYHELERHDDHDDKDKQEDDRFIINKHHHRHRHHYYCHNNGQQNDDDLHILKHKKFISNDCEINNHYNKHLYASDTILNKYYNIYDDPADALITTSYENSLDIMTKAVINNTSYQHQQGFANEVNTKSPKRSSTTRIKQQQSKQKLNSLKNQQNDLCKIYDYNFYYALKKNYQKQNNLQQQLQHQQQNHLKTSSSILYSPLHSYHSSTTTINNGSNLNLHHYHHHHHHHHHHSNNNHLHHYHYHNSSGSNIPSLNRPNSRNSLNSRLSSSHNSLTVPNANKADDSIFITQAMSHDALLSHEISDFYNVPIGADIYSFPIDMIKTPIPILAKSIVTPQKKDYPLNDNPKQQRNIGCGSKLSSSSKVGRFKNPRSNKKRRRNNIIGIKNDAAATIIGGIDKYGGGGGGGSSSSGGGGNKIRPIGGTVSIAVGTSSSNTMNSTKTPHKRHSVPENTITPLHMTLDEVKKFYHSLYSSTSDSNDTLSRNNKCNINNNNNNSNFNNNTISSNTNSIMTKNNGHIIKFINDTGVGTTTTSSGICGMKTIATNITHGTCTSTSTMNNLTINTKSSVNLKNLTNDKNNKHSNNKLHIIKDDIKNNTLITTNNKATFDGKSGGGAVSSNNQSVSSPSEKKSQFFINLNLKQKFCSIFRFRKSNDSRRTSSTMFEPAEYISNNTSSNNTRNIIGDNKFSSRALPPLPNKNSLTKSGTLKSNTSTYDNNNKKDEKKSEFNSAIHFASNIEKVKDYGWYWGPISSEAAEKILSNEPDGSFIVRDSSDDHYIFSLSFKLNNCVRHVRIEQDQGTFSFGSYAKFKSQTITEFIEKAVEHSRSGRYLFFLHRRPEHGPMRVQLTNPVSRFKHIQSLQHMCRFVILKAVVRKDLIQNLPLPRRLLDYLSYKHCYSEQIEFDSSSQSQSSGDGVV